MREMLQWASQGEASGVLFNKFGFTSDDRSVLKQAHLSGVADRGWGQAEFAANDFSHYIAIWQGPASSERPPAIQVIRFAKTGTYALMVRGRVIASDKRLDKILPVLAIVS